MIFLRTQFRRLALPAAVLLAACLAPQSFAQGPSAAPFAIESPASPDAELPAAPTPKVPLAAQGQSQAQTQQPPATAPAPQTPNAQGNSQDHSADEVPKRIFYIWPNFMTANDIDENKGPLTTKEKFNIAWHQFFDISAHVGNLLQASVSQAADGIPHYGQGWGAFGKRFAAQEGDQFTGSILIYGVLPTLLHDDPRYFRKGKGGVFKRILYAASRVAISRTDSGHATFNAPQIFGQLGQAGISTLYYPEQDRTVGGVFQGWAINQCYAMGFNQLKEFTPDLVAALKRHADRKRQEKAAKHAGAAPSTQD